VLLVVTRRRRPVSARIGEPTGEEPDEYR
jgi:hypothetical protein